MNKLGNKEINNSEIYDKNNGLYYTKVGDYYYPNIVVNDEEKYVWKSKITIFKKP